MRQQFGDEQSGFILNVPPGLGKIVFGIKGKGPPKAAAGASIFGGKFTVNLS